MHAIASLPLLAQMIFVEFDAKGYRLALTDARADYFN